MKKLFSRRGFTLIEVLVVIAIIGILSTILYASFKDGRDDALNKALQTEVREVQLALELYRAQNGEYPETAATSGCGTNDSGRQIAESTVCGTAPYIPDLVPDFISVLPSHDESGNSNCVIRYITDNSDPSWYKLVAERCHAGSNTIDQDSEFARCPSICPIGTNDCDPSDPLFNKSYAVYSNGGQCE